ncbi:ABC transporter substrate-binding protein [Nocardia jejuensis]|uniref:ABC transporter substrate-binding protein n=1 Tax=Nocardia jejuensis TaxID=328049 RepID=UPI00082A68D4|nr:ABC transporter substrate-binding protein [Nocardia jejuensis]
MKAQRILVGLVVVLLLVTGCGGRTGPGTEETAVAQTATSGDFGDLKGVCGTGKPSGTPAQGVTATEIKVGVFTDMGFTKNSEFVDAAKVFTSWCNAAGGINGRKIVTDTRDAKLMEVRQRMLDSCREDFALVGGGAALDGLGTKERLSCLLPDFPGQISQQQNVQSDLQYNASASAYVNYFQYTGYYHWLLKEAYPGSAGAVGMINGDSPVTKVLGDKFSEAMIAGGANFVYNDLYPASGVADWTPYAQAIKSKGVKGLMFLGDWRQLTKLEDVLTGMDYKLDWIDANNNAYNRSFLDTAGKSLSFQNNLADLGGTVPAESPTSSPATQQLLDLYKKYAPQADITMPTLRAFSAWLLFAKSAASCGDQLTRACLIAAAGKETAWTGGGLNAPNVVADREVPPKCFNVVQASAQGWKPADFKPNQGEFRCDVPAFRYTGSYDRPLTLADVGKSLSDVK